jgi:hypothetical protein
MEEFDLAWRESLAQPWKERHEFMQTMRERLAAHEAAARERELTDEEQWQRACALEAVAGGAAALVALDALLERQPQHAPALYARGRIRLEADDDRGATDIERAMQLDDEAREPGAQLLYSYFYARHEFSRCDLYRSTLQQIASERDRAALERAQLRSRDRLEPHGLNTEALQPWLDALRAESKVKRAWLARKRVQHLARVPAFVLCVQFRPFTASSDSALQRLADTLSGDHSCLVLSSASARRRLAKLDGSLIFER